MQKFIGERGAKMTFCKFYGTVAVKTLFWRSMFSVLYQWDLFVTVTSIITENDI